jgi:RNA polymerase sigma factor (sigma-70 family)
MKYEYEGRNKTITIEVSDEYHDILIDFDRRERNNNQTEKRRHVSMEAYNLDGNRIPCDVNIVEGFLKDQEMKSIYKAIDSLLPQQKELVKKVFFEKRTLISIAREEGVGESAIRDRLKRIYQKLKKNFK